MVVRLPKWFDARLYGADSPIHGRGLFTNASVEPGEILMRWGGIVIELREYDPTRFRPASTTCYDPSHYLTTPVEEPTSLDELLNHSCDPTLWMLDEVTVAARRSIRPDEELTTDFAMWEDTEHVLTAECACGTATCRRVIAGQDWRLPTLQGRYRGHFLPHLNRTIAELDHEKA